MSYFRIAFKDKPLPDSLPSNVIGFFSDITPLGVLAAVIAIIFLVSLWRSRRQGESYTTSSHLPWTVSLSSFPPEPTPIPHTKDGKSSVTAASFGNDFNVPGKIASLSTKKAVFVIPQDAFPVGSKVYFQFDSSHFAGQYFCGHVTKVRQDQITDAFRVSLVVLDKPSSLSRAVLKKLMLPIAS